MHDSQTIVTELLRCYHGRVQGGGALNRVVKSENLDYLIGCGFGPIVYSIQSHGDRSRSAPQSEAVVSANLTAKIIHHQSRRAVRDILSMAREIGIDVVLLKGISIAYSLYNPPYHRIMADVDLLVPPDSAAQMQELLLSLGYAPIPVAGRPDVPLAHHHLPELRNAELGVTVEIHTRLMSSNGYATLRLNRPDFFWQETRRTSFDGVDCLRFGFAYQLVHTVTHWALDRRWGTNIIGINDIIHLINHLSLESDWRKIEEWMQDYPAFADILTVLCRLLADYELIDLPVSLEQELQAASRRVGAINLRILHWLLRTFPLSGKRRSLLIFTSDNAVGLWRAILEPRPKYLRLPYALWRGVLSRYRSLLGTVAGSDKTLPPSYSE